MENIKGFVATIITPGTFIALWMPWIEVGLKLSIGVLGVFAGLYAARYWKLKLERLEAKRRIEEDSDL